MESERVIGSGAMPLGSGRDGEGGMAARRVSVPAKLLPMGKIEDEQSTGLVKNG